MKFEVGFEGWIEIDADTEEEAFAAAFDKVSTALSPLCNSGQTGDFEVTEVSEVE